MKIKTHMDWDRAKVIFWIVAVLVGILFWVLVYKATLGRATPVIPWCHKEIFLQMPQYMVDSLWPGADMPIYYCYEDDDGDNHADLVKIYAYNPDEHLSDPRDKWTLIEVMMPMEFAYMGDGGRHE